MGEARTVLLVDDDALTREVLLMMLTAAGWDVVQADGGMAALGLLRGMEVPPALILCDLRMPGLCGSGLAAELRGVLRGAAGGAGTVLLAMTATEVAGAAEGYDGLLVKPFEAGAVEDLWRGRLVGAGESMRVSPVSAPVEDAAIDGAVWKQLQRSMPETQMRALYAMALGDAEMRVRRMEAAVEARDDAAFRREAHGLKGSCGMVGAERLAKLAAGAEAEGFVEVTKNKVTSGTNFKRFSEEIANFRHMLEVLTSREPSG